MSDEGPKRPDDEAKERARAEDGEDREDRALILARREMLIATALAGFAVTAEACDALDRPVSPQPCLSPMPPRDRLAPCLTPVPTEVGVDAGPPRADGVDSADAGTQAPPTPCLKVRAPDPAVLRGLPRACLSVRAPRSMPQACLEVMRPSEKATDDGE